MLTDVRFARPLVNRCHPVGSRACGPDADGCLQLLTQTIPGGRFRGRGPNENEASGCAAPGMAARCVAEATRPTPLSGAGRAPLDADGFGSPPALSGTGRTLGRETDPVPGTGGRRFRRFAKARRSRQTRQEFVGPMPSRTSRMMQASEKRHNNEIRLFFIFL